MDGYIPKPFRSSHLKEAIQTLFLPDKNEQISKLPKAEYPLGLSDREQSVFRLDDALAGVDDDMSLLLQLAEMFVNDAPEYLQNIRGAIEKQDHEGLRKHSHKLKGAVTNFSAQEAYDSSLKLEKMGKTNENWPDIDQQYALLVNRIQDLQEALHAFRKAEKS